MFLQDECPHANTDYHEAEQVCTDCGATAPITSRDADGFATSNMYRGDEVMRAFQKKNPYAWRYGPYAGMSCQCEAGAHFTDHPSDEQSRAHGGGHMFGAAFPTVIRVSPAYVMCPPCAEAHRVFQAAQ